MVTRYKPKDGMEPVDPEEGIDEVEHYVKYVDYENLKSKLDKAQEELPYLEGQVEKLKDDMHILEIEADELYEALVSKTCRTDYDRCR